jgi:hypothetical protein
MPQFESVFGSLRPKFVYDLGGANEATVSLTNFIPGKDEPEEDRSVIQTDELSDNRMIIYRGNFWEFSGIVQCFRLVDWELIRMKMEEIYAYNNKLVVLHKYSDGPAYLDSAGVPIKWYLTCYPKSRESLDYRDIMVVNFRSLKAPDFSQML